MEQVITLSGGFILREGGNQLHRFQSPVDPRGGRGGITECLGELLVDPGDLKAAFVTTKNNDLVSCERQGAKSTYLLSAANKSSMYDLIPRIKSMMSKQSATIDARERFRSKGVKNEFLDVVGQRLAFPEDIPGAVEKDITYPSVVRDSEREVLPEPASAPVRNHRRYDPQY